VARNGIEMALLDIWARFAQKPLFKFIGNSGAQKACFYTGISTGYVNLVVESIDLVVGDCF
jgi:L-alanine-DL-glutamate epimerase-like enolase superfamily enzyme